MEFERVFWPTEFGVFTRAVRSDAERGNLQTWVNINRFVAKPVLTGFLCGQPAVEFEKLDSEEAKNLGKLSCVFCLLNYSSIYVFVHGSQKHNLKML